LCKRSQLPFSLNYNVALKFHSSYFSRNLRQNYLIAVVLPYKFSVTHTLFIKRVINTVLIVNFCKLHFSNISSDFILRSILLYEYFVSGLY